MYDESCGVKCGFSMKRDLILNELKFGKDKILCCDTYNYFFCGRMRFNDDMFHG